VVVVLMMGDDSDNRFRDAMQNTEQRRDDEH